MLFFGKSKKAETALPEARIDTIPPDFYGGANPIVKFKKVEKEIAVRSSGSLTPGEKALLDKETAVGGKALLHPANLLANRKFLVFAGVGMFLIILAAGGVYYWLQLKKQKMATPAQQIAFSPPDKISAAADQPLPETESAISAEATSTPPETLLSESEPEIKFPSRWLADSADMDNDDISDAAEELFSTDPGVADSDGDKYPDGHEIFYLYNPSGLEPQKIVESNLVKEFANPVYGYSAYYPSNWALGNTDQSFKEVLFSTLTGEYVEIRVADKDADETFQDWFAKRAANEQLADYAEFSSRFGVNGFRRSDYLVYFFPGADKVYVITYHATDSNVANYRIVVKMLARSFRLPDNTSTLSPRAVEENLTGVISETTSSASTGAVPTVAVSSSSR